MLVGLTPTPLSAGGEKFPTVGIPEVTNKFVLEFRLKEDLKNKITSRKIRVLFESVSRLEGTK